MGRRVPVQPGRFLHAPALVLLLLLPTNVVRLLPSLPGYLYAVKDDRLFVNLYVANEGQARVAGVDVQLTQETRYPWEGQVRLTVTPEKPARFSLALRIPGWVKGRPVPSDLYSYLNADPAAYEVCVNGQPVSAVEEDGYFSIDRTWTPGDVIEISFAMPIRAGDLTPAGGSQSRAGRPGARTAPLRRGRRG